MLFRDFRNVTLKKLWFLIPQWLGSTFRLYTIMLDISKNVLLAPFNMEGQKSHLNHVSILHFFAAFLHQNVMFGQGFNCLPLKFQTVPSPSWLLSWETPGSASATSALQTAADWQAGTSYPYDHYDHHTLVLTATGLKTRVAEKGHWFIRWRFHWKYS